MKKLKEKKIIITDQYHELRHSPKLNQLCCYILNVYAYLYTYTYFSTHKTIIIMNKL